MFNILLLQFYNPFQRLTERDGCIVVIVEVDLMRQVRGRVEETVEFAFHLITVAV